MTRPYFSPRPELVHLVAHHVSRFTFHSRLHPLAPLCYTSLQTRPSGRVLTVWRFLVLDFWYKSNLKSKIENPKSHGTLPVGSRTSVQRGISPSPYPHQANEIP